MPVTITEVPSSAARNTGRTTWNANDVSLKEGINALELSFDAHQSAGHPGVHPTVTDLNTHKTSADHDGRYYTESEIDALIANMVKLTTDQTIDGIKTFLKNIILKKAVPAVEFQNASAEELAKLSADKDGSGNITVTLQQWLAGAYKDIMKATNLGFVNFPRGAGMNDRRFATEEYVQARVKSGTIFVSGVNTEAVGEGESKMVKDSDGIATDFIIPDSSRIIELKILQRGSAVIHTFPCNIPAGIYMIEVNRYTGTNMDVVIYNSYGFVEVFTTDQFSADNAIPYKFKVQLTISI